MRCSTCELPIREGAHRPQWPDTTQTRKSLLLPAGLAWANTMMFLMRLRVDMVFFSLPTRRHDSPKSKSNHEWSDLAAAMPGRRHVNHQSCYAPSGSLLEGPTDVSREGGPVFLRNGSRRRSITNSLSNSVTNDQMHEPSLRFAGRHRWRTDWVVRSAARRKRDTHARMKNSANVFDLSV